MILTIWTYFIIFIVTILFIFPIIVVGSLDSKKIILSYLTRAWAKLILYFSFIKYDIIGFDKISKIDNYILIANHQSLFDILVIFATIKHPISFFTKKELFYIPLFGWGLKAAGMVYVDRQNKKQSKLSVSYAIEKIENTNLSMLIFPEATRSHYKKIKEFKKGGFILAIQTSKPIVPITINYTKNPNIVQSYQKISVVVGDVLDTLDYNIEQKDNLIVKIKDAISNNLNAK